MAIAVDREQASIVLRYIQGYFAAVPMLGALVVRSTLSGLELSNGVDIVVAASNFRSIRGKTIALAILDECAFCVLRMAALRARTPKFIRPWCRRCRRRARLGR